MLTAQLLTALRPMIGFRPDDSSTEEADALTDELKKTTTGVTLDQCHELLQLSTLRKAYRQGVTSFPAYLARTRDDSIRALLDTISTRLIEASLAGQLLKPTQLFGPLSSAPVMIVPTGRRVGLMITPLKTDVTILLERVRFSGSFDEGFELSLNKLLSNDPDTSIALTAANAWQDTDDLPFQNGISYLLSYPETALGAGNSAKNTLTQWPKEKTGCGNCAGCLGNYVKVEAVVIEDDLITVTNETNYGLNVVLSATGDVTGRLVDNPRRVLPALKQQLASTFLEKIAFGTRHNGPAEEAIQGALYALTDKDNANRVPLLLDRAVSSLVKALGEEASKAIVVNTDQDITWGTI